MRYFIKKIPLLLILMVTLGTGLGYSAPLHDHPRPITGTWLYLWWHGSASIGKADGTATSRFMFVPESYRESGEQKSESYFHFRADGTGLFFRRYVAFSYQKRKTIITVFTKKPGGEWAAIDQLDTTAGFRWQIKGNQLILKAIDVGTRFEKTGRYEFVINAVPTKPASRDLRLRMKLQDELIIYQLGQFLRLGKETEQELLNKYGIL